ncbi:MAG: helix-turn-helix domain-containing protein [Pseudonocardiaceae bacterium]
MRDGHVVNQARLALGAQLAARRQAAGETQRSLAHKLPYSRSTIAGVETGRQHAPLTFWRSCDERRRQGAVSRAPR